MNNKLNLYFEGQDENSKLIYSIGLLWGKISNELDSILGEYGLNISKFNILMIIKHIGGDNGIQQNEISKRLLVTASNITKLLDKLEKDSMITRNNKQSDKRVKLIKVTETASKLLDTVWPLYTEAIKEITVSINKNNAKVLDKILLEWLTNIK